MYNKWSVDATDSVKAIESIIGTILPKLINGEIVSVEGQNNDVLIMLDTLSGVDYIRIDNSGLQGIAARVQWGKNWDTFTIRAERHTGTKTEYEKRVEQIKKGYFYPAFTMQAYFDNRTDNNLESIAIIKTLDLYEFIEKYPNKVQTRFSDNKFYYIKWDDIKDYYEMKIYRA